MCEQFPNKRGLVEVVDEGPPAVDLEDGKPLAIARLQTGIAGDVDEFVGDRQPLELLLGPLTQAAALPRVENDARDRARG